MIKYSIYYSIDILILFKTQNYKILIEEKQGFTKITTAGPTFWVLGA